jgi:hypothetical protein
MLRFLAYVCCNQDEVLTGGGYYLGGNGAEGGDAIPIASAPDNNNNWYLATFFDGDGTYQAYALCMKVEVGIKTSPGGNLIGGKSSNLGIITKPGSDIIKEPVP